MLARKLRMATEAEMFEANVRREREFMRCLGEAIAAWQAVEQVFYEVYLRLMKGANQRLISVTFFHIQSFTSRVNLGRELIK
jgi:hypothetical protein